MWRKSVIFIFIINLCFFPTISNGYLPIQWPHSSDSLKNNENESAQSQFFFQNSDLNISIYVMQIIFIRGEIIINIASNITTRLHILFILTENVSYFQFSQPDTLDISPGLTFFKYILNMSIFIHPGQYQFFISIYQESLNDHNPGEFLFVQPFEIYVIGGPILFYVSTILLGFILFFILIQREVLTKLPPMNSRVPRRKWLYKIFPILKKQTTHHLILKLNQERRFIRCPDCGKRIIENIAFCCWCGYHLRRFERFSLE